MNFQVGDHVVIKNIAELDEVFSDYADYLKANDIRQTQESFDYFRNVIKTNSGKEYIIKEIVSDRFDYYLRFEGDYSVDFKNRKIFSRFCNSVNNNQNNSIPVMYGA